MTLWVRLTLFAVLTLALGCNRPGGTGAPVAPAGGAAPAANDYRLMSKAQLQDFIKSKIGIEEMTLTEKATNTYSGTLKHLDGTNLPVEVTVEAQRIVCETKTPAGSTRQIITPQGTTSDLNVK
jgi:hypothetical protein